MTGHDNSPRTVSVSEGELAMPESGGRTKEPPASGKTLLDLRGIIPVEGPQDFIAVRHAVKRLRAREVARSDG